MAKTQIVMPVDLTIQGNFYASTMTLPAASVADSQVSSAAGVQASKLQHQYEPVLAQPNGTAATAETQVLHAVYGTTATVLAVHAGAVTPLVGADTCTIDVKKNGTTILTGVISLANTDTAYQMHSGTIATSSAVAGDVFTAVITPTHTSGTLPQGVFVRLVLREDAQ